MWPGECWATSTPSQQLTRPLPPHLSPQEDGKECLPLTCLSVNPDPKKIPSNQRAVPTEVLRDLGRGGGDGNDMPRASSTDPAPAPPQECGRGTGRLPVLGATHHHGRGHLGHGADQGGYRQRELRGGTWSLGWGCLPPPLGKHLGLASPLPPPPPTLGETTPGFRLQHLEGLAVGWRHRPHQ